MLKHARTTAALVAASLINVAAIYYRRPDSFYNPQFYAEEGKIFFADAYHSSWASLLNTTNGYFHLFPRLVSILSLTFDVPYLHIPAIFNSCCLLIYFLLWYYIFKRLELPLIARFFIALSTVLIPIGNEIMMNLTNIQWFMALFPVIIFSGKKPELISARILDVFILILCTFTGPYILILLPAFLIGLYLNKESARERSSFLLICFAASVACIISLLQFGTVERTAGDFQLFNYGFVQMFFYQYYFPLLSIGMYKVPSWAVFILSAGCFTVLFILMKNIIRAKNKFATVSFIAGIFFFITTTISYHKDPIHMSPLDNCIRNFYLPMVFLLWSVLAITRFTAFRIITWFALFIWFAVQTVLFVPLRKYEDLSWPDYANQIGKVDSLTISINPAGWKMTLMKPEPSN